MAEWISVDTALPEIGEDVLTRRESGSYQIEQAMVRAMYGAPESVNVSIEWECDWGEDGAVTHWMPLPDPPEEVQDDG